jgi:hypothetical protein
MILHQLIHPRANYLSFFFVQAQIQGSVYSIAVLHDPAPAAEINEILSKQEDEDGVEVISREDGSSSKRVKIKRKGEKEQTQFMDALKVDK